MHWCDNLANPFDQLQKEQLSFSNMNWLFCNAKEAEWSSHTTNKPKIGFECADFVIVLC